MCSGGYFSSAQKQKIPCIVGLMEGSKYRESMYKNLLKTARELQLMSNDDSNPNSLA